MNRTDIENLTIGSHKMLIFNNIHDLKSWLEDKKREKCKIGFVPTMGALHDGHVSLMKKAKEENDVVVVSIFVNPTQFNNPEDLKNYPRTPEEDSSMLSKNSVDVLFSPDVNEMYNDNFKKEINLELGKLETVMEGAHRPGHFAGVVQIVSRLFDIVNPDKAYFGEKDFQQLAIIRFITEALKYKVEIIACPTVREKNGLAMSSRNLRLTEKGRIDAAGIYQTLLYMKENKEKFSPEEMKQQAIRRINSNENLKTEYVEIADEKTLQPIMNWDHKNNARIFAAVFCEGVRLIDNVML